MGRLNKKEFIEKYGEEAWREESKKRSQKAMDWAKKNPEKHAAALKKWKDSVEYEKNRYTNNKNAEQKRNKGYYKTPNGRAHNLSKLYRTTDKKYERGDSTITQKWILENIFTSSCVYCGETNWKKLGCDRIDNEKAHTPDNCVCACGSCNVERGNRWSVEEFKRLKGGPELDHPAANNM